MQKVFLRDEGTLWIFPRAGKPIPSTTKVQVTPIQFMLSLDPNNHDNQI
jgi:hypothetical protein